jgi:hypothetical protein
MEVSMFESLDEQMKKDEDRVISPKERILRYLIYVIVGAAVFGGIFLGVRSLS